jgi:asparagine synthase (glutamine-hydrolysing)
VFDYARVDERRFMDAVIAKTHARGVFTSVDPLALFETAADVIWHQDEPYGSTSIHAQWAVFRAAREAGITVMLDGQGADEPLAGYHSMFGVALADLIGKGRAMAVANMLIARRRIHGQPIRGQLTGALPTLIPKGMRKYAYRARREVAGADWLDGPALAHLRNAPDPLVQAAQHYGFKGRLDIGALTTLQTLATSLPMLLHWEDRSSMAHGIEARVPFLDHRLVELAIGLGGRHKIDGATSKVMLREGLGRYLPDSVRTRNDKLGFATPEQEWFCGPLAPAVRQAVVNTLDRYPTLLHREATLAMTDEMLSGKRAFNFSLWRIASLGLWGQRFGMTM